MKSSPFMLYLYYIMKIYLKIIVVVLQLVAGPIFSQSDSLVAYSHEYDFKEGIFVTIEQFKRNSPLGRDFIVTQLNKEDIDFFKQLVHQKEIGFKDKFDSIRILETNNIWGYSQNGAIYLNFNNEFNKLNVIGSLCHFTATIKVPVSFGPPMIGYNYGMMNSNANTYELRQFVLDIQTNRIIDFNEKNMEILLSRDEELNQKFMKLKKRKRGEAIFPFLRAYNDKHPLYLPLK